MPQRSIRATPEGIQRLHAAQVSFEDGRLTYEAIASKLQINERTVGRFFRGEGVDKANAYAIIKFLRLSNNDVLPSEDLLVEDSIRKIEHEKSATSERAKELIERLEIALNELKQSEENSLPAMEWLRSNRKTLSRDAAEAVFRRKTGQGSADINTDKLELEQFSQEIRKYLQLLYYCLEEGSWELIDGAIQESSIPTNREISFYTEALTFIKDFEQCSYLL